MNTFAPHILTACSLLALSSVFAQDEPAKIQLLRTGLWHGNEVSVEAGPGWWGVFPEGDGFTLQSAPVSITREIDAIVEDTKDNPTGKRVSVPQKEEPIILLIGLENPMAGPLQGMSAKPPYPYLPPGETLHLQMNDGKSPDTIRMEALGIARERTKLSNRVAVYEYQLNLYQRQGVNTLKQALPIVEVVSEDKPPRLLWAGDLDRDGKLDLLFDLNSHYNVTQLSLFLSSAAKKGELVGLVAEWRTTGC